MASLPAFSLPIAGRLAPRRSGAWQVRDCAQFRRLGLAHGGHIDNAVVAYELTGPKDGPVVAVLGGISAGRDVAPSAHGAGWWNAIAGPGRAIDTRHVRVLSIDYIGGNGHSTGPRTGTTVRPVDSRDQARAIVALLPRLGVDRLHAVVGASYGGMVGLALAEEFPALPGRLVVISAAHEAHPQATAWRSIQRRLVELGGRSGCEGEALALARSLAMVTYRSPRELEQRFSGTPAVREGRHRFPVEDYLEARGAEFAGRFHPAAFLALSESIDLHRIDPARVTTPVTVVAVSSDQLVPVESSRELARRLAGPSELVEIESLHGHDAFLKETATIDAILRARIGGR